MKLQAVLRFRSAPACIAAAGLSLAPALKGQVQVYDSANPAGVWDASTLNWDGSSAAWTNGNDASFATGTGTVAVSPGIALGQLAISSTTVSTIGGIGDSVYRFNGGSLDFGPGTGVIDTVGTGARNSQINSRLLGTGGLEISATGGDSGNGRLVLGGDNSALTGGITVKAGLVSFTTQLAAGSNTLSSTAAASSAAPTTPAPAQPPSTAPTRPWPTRWNSWVRGATPSASGAGAP
jgi:autotransporter-associated beta strand protein